MKALLLAKRGKPFVAEAEKFLGARFDLTACLGQASDPLPKDADRPYDVVISYLSPWIVPGKILRRTRYWNINFHPGPPEYPGTGCYNFALYDNARSYGVTAHLMEEKVDTGRIIGVKRFSVSGRDTIQSLMDKSYRAMYRLFCETMASIEKQSLSFSGERWAHKPYRRAQLEELCRVDPRMSKIEIKKRIRATYFEGRPGPYVEVGGVLFVYKGGLR